MIKFNSEFGPSINDGYYMLSNGKTSIKVYVLKGELWLKASDPESIPSTDLDYLDLGNEGLFLRASEIAVKYPELRKTIEDHAEQLGIKLWKE